MDDEVGGPVPGESLGQMEIEEADPIPNDQPKTSKGSIIRCTVLEAFGGKCDGTAPNDLKHFEHLTETEAQAIKCKLHSGLLGNARFCKIHYEQLSMVEKNKVRPGKCEGFHGISHRRYVKADPLSAVTFYKSFEGNTEGIVPGIRICVHCSQKVREGMVDPANATDNLDADYEPPETLFEQFDKILQVAGVDSFRYKKLSLESRRRLAASRIRELVEVCLKSLHNGGLEVKKSELFPRFKQDLELQKSFDSVMGNLKQKYEKSNYREKVQVLTVAPANWSNKQTVDYFTTDTANCTAYRVRLARALKKTNGPMTIPRQKKGKCVSNATKKLVQSFYLEDSISRVFPGMRDTIPVKVNGVKVRKVKRLLLGNLRDIHKLYIKQHATTNPIGFIRFCTLRPKEIVLANARGVHNVCVCQYHGNVTLMLEAIRENKAFRSKLFDALVCENVVDGENVRMEQCMLGTCKTCQRPNPQKKQLFTEMVMKSIQTKLKKDSVKYSQWSKAESHIQLETKVAQVDEFVETLYHKFVDLLPHHFISGTQAIEFKRMRTLEFLGDDKMVVQVDFGENYSFLVQDAPQSFHWETTQATIHPFGAWLKVGNEVKYVSSAVISDERRHDTESFFSFLKIFLEWILKEYPHIKHIEYWSDGCGGQYKNCKNFDNLLQHKNDFGISATWNFFATSHGKGAVDGISALLKQSARRRSMTAINENHILTPKQLFDHCYTALPNIKLFYVTSENIEEISAQHNLDERFAKASTYPQTRMCHKLVSNGCSLEMYRTSKDSKPFNKVTEGNPSEGTFEVEKGEWVAARYSSTWYLARVIDINEEAGVAQVHFVEKPGDSPSYKFCGKLEHNSAWVPYSEIIAKVTPTTGKTTRTRSHYFLSVLDRSLIEKKI